MRVSQTDTGSIFRLHLKLKEKRSRMMSGSLEADSHNYLCDCLVYTLLYAYYISLMIAALLQPVKADSEKDSKKT